MMGMTERQRKNYRNPTCRHPWRRKWIVRLHARATLTGVYCKKCAKKHWPKARLERFKRGMK